LSRRDAILAATLGEAKNYGSTPAAASPLAGTKGLDVTPATSLVTPPPTRIFNVTAPASSSTDKVNQQ
jgi:hypothetical protein